MRFVRGDLLIGYLVEKGVLPKGATDLKIEADCEGSPLYITSKWLATDEDLKILTDLDYITTNLDKS